MAHKVTIYSAFKDRKTNEFPKQIIDIPKTRVIDMTWGDNGGITWDASLKQFFLNPTREARKAGASRIPVVRLDAKSVIKKNAVLMRHQPQPKAEIRNGKAVKVNLNPRFYAIHKDIEEQANDIPKAVQNDSLFNLFASRIDS